MQNILLGCLLGDSSLTHIRTTGMWRVDFGHGQSQYPYLLWKRDLLNCHTKVGHRMSGFGFPIHYFRYSNAPVLRQLVPICLNKGKKVVTPEWIARMDALSLALWYQDDGSWSRGPNRPRQRSMRRAKFATNSFDLHSIKLLRDWLLSKFGIKSALRFEKKKYPIIVTGSRGTRRLWEIVAPFIVIKHKLDLSVRPGWLRCQCGRYIDFRAKFCDICLKHKLLQGEIKSRHFLIHRFGVKTLAELQRITPHYVKPSDIFWFDHSRLRRFLC